MIAQKDAVARLLRDGDPETVRLVKEQLIMGGEDNVNDLEHLATLDDAAVSGHAREALATILAHEAEDEFELLCRFFSDSLDIEPALWMMAAAIKPALEIRKFQIKVESWGRQFTVLASNAVSSRERVIALADFMAGDLCFRGNAENYYCENNSLLPRVIETRAGNPLSLVMLYRMVALRAGMIVDGINMPGHFVARHEDVIFDPFHKGRILTRKQCGQILAKQHISMKSCHLLPATPRQTLVRALANLLYVYDLDGDGTRHDQVAHWLSLLCDGA
jgi:hypothetical protein